MHPQRVIASRSAFSSSPFFVKVLPFLGLEKERKRNHRAESGGSPFAFAEIRCGDWDWEGGWVLCASSRWLYVRFRLVGTSVGIGGCSSFVVGMREALFSVQAFVVWGPDPWGYVDVNLAVAGAFVL